VTARRPRVGLSSRFSRARIAGASLLLLLGAGGGAPAFADGASDADTTADAGHVVDPENKSKPDLESADLTERASHLFEAIVKDDPSLGDDFFFPKEPFIPLKDVANPGKYFDQLLATYHRDVRALHRKRKSWDDAKFVSFTLGSTPTWVAPGKEYNKIGYYRTFRGKLRYEIDGQSHVLDVMTIISWDGHWYVTHLLPIKH
jgi:hypothetical protein